MISWGWYIIVSNHHTYRPDYTMKGRWWVYAINDKNRKPETIRCKVIKTCENIS